jgi:hypothetical protein
MIKRQWVRIAGERRVTYREVWHRARTSQRRGGYGRSWAELRRAYLDLVAATGWYVRPAMMLAVLGYGLPRIVEVDQ